MPDAPSNASVNEAREKRSEEAWGFFVNACAAAVHYEYDGEDWHELIDAGESLAASIRAEYDGREKVAARLCKGIEHTLALPNHTFGGCLACNDAGEAMREWHELNGGTDAV